MKIGIFVAQVANAKGYEDTVSAHVQLPMQTIKLLQEKGHEAQLITTEYGSDRTLPNCLPDGVTIHTVTDGRERGGGVAMEVGRHEGIKVLKIIKQLYQIVNICRKEKFDLIHLFGGQRTAGLGGVLRLLGVRTPIFASLIVADFPKQPSFISTFLHNRVDKIFVATEYVKSLCKKHGIDTLVIRHGISRKIINDEDNRGEIKLHRVLFWRDPSKDNGADICLNVYRKLAPEFPDISFVMAVRRHWDPVPGFPEIEDQYENVEVYKVPYPTGISISKLMSETICVLLPFERLDCHPQLVIPESMMAAKPVVTTFLESNIEMIESGIDGILVPVGDLDKTVAAVKQLLTDRDMAIEMGRRARISASANWKHETYIDKLLDVYEGYSGIVD